jgi:transposase-like protein
VVNVATVIATAVTVQVKREVLDLDVVVVTNENGAGSKAFLRSLVARGIAGGEDGDSQRSPGS